MGRPLFGTAQYEHAPTLTGVGTASSTPSGASSIDADSLVLENLISLVSALSSALPSSQTPDGLSATSREHNPNSRTAELLQNLATSQASLQRAATLLESTFSRVRQLRSVLAQRRSQMPPNNSPTMTPAQNTTPSTIMGPGHDAILLSDSNSGQSRSIDEALIIDNLRSSSSWPRADTESGERSDLRLDGDRIMRVVEEVRETRRRMERGEHFPVSFSESTGQVSSRPSLRSSTTSSLRFGPRGEASQTQTQSRRSAIEHLLSRPRDSMAEASTSLGRRVAARAAIGYTAHTGTDRIDDARGTALLDDTAQRIMEITTNLRNDIRLVAEHNERMNQLVQRARPSSVPSSASSPSAPTTDRQNGVNMQSNSGWRSVPHQPQRMSSRSTMGDFRSRPSGRRPGTSEATASHIEVAGRQRDEQSHPSFPADVLSSLPNSLYDDNESGAEPRWDSSYRVRRQFNADGEEHVHNVMLDDDYDPFSWLVPPHQRDEPRGEARRSTTRTRQPARERTAPNLYDTWAVYDERRRRERGAQSNTTLPGAPRADNPPSNSSSYRRRRRGWARLDQDGNEIPTDEEEEYERNRTLMRARAAQLASGQSVRRLEPSAPRLPPPPPPPHRRLSFVPTTQSSLWQSYNGDGGARVRINPAAPSPYADASALSDPDTPTTLSEQLDDDDEENPPPPEVIGSTVPFTPSPLPLPLVDLSRSSTRKHVTPRLSQPIRVPRDGYWAGR